MKRTSNLKVLFEDRDFIVIHKPAGLLSVGYPGYSGKSAEDILTDMFRGKGTVRVRAVHRLDRETSGILMFARSDEARTVMMDRWQELVSQRLYRCVCLQLRHPRKEELPPSGVIDAPLTYNRQHKASVSEKEAVPWAAQRAEKAVTRFRVVQRGKACDLVECELETGRKNQIRIHMAYLGHPVAGDPVYGAENAVFSRYGLALHARVLAFIHPFTKESLRFEVPEPDFFHTLLFVQAADTFASDKAGAKTVGSGRAAVSRAEKAEFSRKVKPGRGHQGSKYIPKK